MLTFDDGPTAVHGHTDKIVQTLRGLGVSGIFFALGKSLQARRQSADDQSLRALYAGQCLASHGLTHGSHAKMADWRASVETTRDLVRAITQRKAPAPVPFRPPYGQRSKAMAVEAAKAESPIVLWNIDSQDWSPPDAERGIA